MVGRDRILPYMKRSPYARFCNSKAKTDPLGELLLRDKQIISLSKKVKNVDNNLWERL